MKSKHRRWLFVWAMIYAVIDVFHCEFIKNSTNPHRHSTENSTKMQEPRSVFSPRMDYEQWTPIGRGDPLKNDPTYDYVPPILERVHYWIDPQSRKPDPELALDADATTKNASNENTNPHQKTEILVLGVSSKKPSIPSVQPPLQQADARRDIYEPSYIKYVEHSAPKYQQNHYQRERIFYPYSHYFPMPPTSYKSKLDRYKPHQVPYTILMPPPPPIPTTERITTESPSGVTLQQANLIYHSSTTLQTDSHLQSLRDEHENYHTADSSSITWRTPLILPVTSRPQLPVTGAYKMGKVENAHIDDAYVNIGKPEAHIHPEPNNLVNLLKKEISKETTQEHLNPNIPATMTSFLANIPKATTKVYTTTTTPTPSTTTSNTLTTDPLFKHYRQPAEPLRGPMYLIIQGHSKVKTYGPAKQLFGINVQEINAIPNYDNHKDFPVKHLHTHRKKEEYQGGNYRNGRNFDVNSLADIANTGYGAINDAFKLGDDVKETELASGFEVAESQDASMVDAEVYHKGIVEAVTGSIEGQREIAHDQ